MPMSSRLPRASSTPLPSCNIFSTNPTTEGTNYARNFFCEAICTFVFISAILAAASRAGENVLMLAICVGLIVWAVGMGWAASPASP